VSDEEKADAMRLMTVNQFSPAISTVEIVSKQGKMLDFIVSTTWFAQDCEHFCIHSIQIKGDVLTGFSFLPA